MDLKDFRKEDQGYQPRPMHVGCVDCKNVLSEIVNKNGGQANVDAHFIRTHFRCSVGLFAVSKKAICRLFEEKVKAKEYVFPPQLIEPLTKIINYLHDDERKHYDETLGRGMAEHIYTDIACVKRWLDATQRAG